MKNFPHSTFRFARCTTCDDDDDDDDDDNDDCDNNNNNNNNNNDDDDDDDDYNRLVLVQLLYKMVNLIHPLWH